MSARTLRSAVVVMLVCAGPSLAAADLLGEIDARRARGDIDDEACHFLRMAALRDRSQLPPDLRSLEIDPRAGVEGTRIAVEAFRWVVANQAQGGRVHRLLLPPPDLANILDSATLPIRVSYDDSGLEELAEAVLVVAEQAWTTQTETYGFYPPILEAGAERYRIHVVSGDATAPAYTSPYGENPDTDWFDCYSFVVIPTAVPVNSPGGHVAHELNHAMQVSMDCGELLTFNENTSTYIQSQEFPDAMGDTLWKIGFFQMQPWRALDYMNPEHRDGYEYGGALWAIYLAATYAPTAGPRLMSQIWEHSMQNDHENSKTYYDAISEVIAGLGGPDFDTLFVDFSEARYFVGSKSDERHIPGASSLAGAELWAVTARKASSLPIENAVPKEDVRPAPYGSNHIVLTLGDGYSGKLRVFFDGAEDTRWATRVVLVGPNDTRSEPMTLDQATPQGTLEVDATGYGTLLFVVANLGLESYSPNDRVWPVSNYSYGIEPVLPPPTVTAAVPDTVVQGTDSAAVELHGTGFVNGMRFAVAFDDPLLQVLSVDSVTSDVIGVTLAVPGTTPVGPKSVTVTNRDGTQGAGTGVLTVVAATPGGDHGDGGPDGPDSGGGCGCVSAGRRDPRRGSGKAGDPAAALLLGLPLLGFALRRNRRAR
jgi:hypothetical protein